MSLDVLTLLLTSNHFLSLFNDRAVWLDLYLRYKDTLEPRQHWPDRPLEFYDANEIQNLVLSPFKADCAWKTDDLAPSSQRSIPISRGYIHSAQLIRGGRWFLWGTDRG